ncbi:MAG: tetratricopeptide repeat protein [Bacteroidetes bacterium]|nr:tetratricopeptide repeat protein [Bacteroidota bacterium]
MKKLLYSFFLLTIHCSLFTVHCFSQDHPAPKPPVLPFQTNAADNNDEQIAMQFFQNREFDKAAEVYERLYAAKPSSYLYTYYLFCLVEIQDFGKAEKLVKSVQKSEPDALKYTVDMGYIAFRKGDPEKAKKLYEEALKKLGPNQQQIFDLANAFITRNENEYAIKVYQKGRIMLNNSYPFGFELAMMYERTGEFKKVLDEYFNLLESNRSYLSTVEDRLQYDLANDPDESKNEMFRKYLLELAQKNPEKTYYSEMLWWYSVQQKDFELALIQARSLDRRLGEDGGRVFQLAKMAISNQEYTAAIEAYKYLVSKGKEFPYYYESRTELLNTRFLLMTYHPNPALKELTELEKEFKAELEITDNHAQWVALTKNLAHLDAFYLGKNEEAIAMLLNVTEKPTVDPKLRAQAKLELADIYLFTDDAWDATLLYQQVYLDFKTEEIGEGAKFKNSKLSYYIGEFKWAQSQLDILKASTSKLIANDAMALSLLISENFDPDSTTIALTYYSHADLLEYRNKYEEALKTLDSIALAFKYHPIFTHMYMAKANIMMETGRFAEADTLLGTIVTTYPDDVLADQALYFRAKMNEEEVKNNSKAMALYESLMSRYPGSIYVPDARKRFRVLRGDKGF